MQKEKSLTQFSQQYQNIVQEVEQILQEKKSTIQPPKQLLSLDNNFPSAFNVSFTGIKEFDKLLDGGFTKGSIILLAGSSGSGKTIFSFQWLFEGIKNNENGIYITLTEPLFKTLENLEELSFYNKKAIENEKLRIVDLRKVYGKEGFDQQKILDFIESEVKRTNAKRLCIDSITAIAYQLDDRAKIRTFIFALGTALATLGCTTVLTSEVSEMNKYSKYEVEEFIADAILRFDQIKEKDEPQRIMQIIKVRGRNHRSDDIYFKITKDGITVFPKLRVPLEHFSTTERISMGISTLDDMLGGGIFVGSSTLITGSPGTGKSTLGLSFLANGSKNGEKCLYIGFEESKKQVLRNAKNFGWDFEKYEREGLLIMRCIYLNEKHLEEHLADIKQIVEEKKIKRCVVDPISAISSAFSPDAFISFSKRLNGYLKTREVTPLFTSTTNSLIGNTKDVDSHISTISDNIILLRYVEMQGDVQCVINIIKMRGSEHSKNLRLYNITDKGLVVGKSLEGYEGVTTGVSKKIAELEKEGKELKEVIKQKEMAEKVLRESEEKFRLLFNDSPLGIALVDTEGIIKEVNNSLLQLLSIKKEEFIGKNFIQLTSAYGLNAQEQTSDFKNRITGKPSKREITFLSKDNKKATITIQSSIIKSSDKIIGILFILEDITERKRAEEALGDSEERFKAIFDGAIDGILLADIGDKKFFTGNKAICRMLGYNLDEIKNLGVMEIHPKEDLPFVVEQFEKLTRNEIILAENIPMKRKDGSIFYADISSTPITLTGKTYLVGLFRDITERKRAQEKLKVANEKLNQIKSDFFEVTTREIRSPLTTIKGYVEMLSNRAFGEINDEQKKYLEIMLRNTNQLDNLVSDLVDISSIELGDMTFTLKKTSISKMVNEAVEKIQSSANVKNIAVNIEIEDQIPDLIIDQDRIKQVLINILGYTIKFSPDKTTVNLRAKKQETDVLFEIQDQGLNIPKDKQKKIFNAFYQAEEGKSKEYLGGGIRFALSRGIVTVHGGKIWVESEDGNGSKFRFTLPIKPVDNIQTRYKESDIFESKKDDKNIEIN